MGLDQKVVEGIQLWFRARQAEAIKSDNRELYLSLCLLLEDLAGSVFKAEYPWDTLMRAFMEMETKNPTKPPVVSRPTLRIVK